MVTAMVQEFTSILGFIINTIQGNTIITQGTTTTLRITIATIVPTIITLEAIIITETILTNIKTVFRFTLDSKVRKYHLFTLQEGKQVA
jgi:hypothetical protein